LQGKIFACFSLCVLCVVLCCVVCVCVLCVLCCVYCVCVCARVCVYVCVPVREGGEWGNSSYVTSLSFQHWLQILHENVPLLPLCTTVTHRGWPVTIQL